VPGSRERRELLLRDMLMIERDHVTSGCEGQQVIGGPVVAEYGVGAHLRGALVGRRGEDPEPDAQPDRGCGRHAGQLAGPDHADDALPAGLTVSGLGSRDGSSGRGTGVLTSCRRAAPTAASRGALASFLVLHYPP